MCMLSRLLMPSAKKSPPYATWRTTVKCSTLLNSSLACFVVLWPTATRKHLLLWNRCRSNKCEVRGWGNVEDVYRGCIVSAGHGDRWTNIVLLGDVGHRAWLTILHSHQAICHSAKPGWGRTDKVTDSYYFSLTRDLLCQCSVWNRPLQHSCSKHIIANVLL